MQTIYLLCGESIILKGSKEFNTSHAISGQMSENGKNFEYPELSVENYK